MLKFTSFFFLFFTQTRLAGAAERTPIKWYQVRSFVELDFFTPIIFTLHAGSRPMSPFCQWWFVTWKCTLTTTACTVSRSADCYSLLFHLASTAQYPTIISNVCFPDSGCHPHQRCNTSIHRPRQLHGFMSLSGPIHTRATRQHGVVREIGHELTTSTYQRQ